MKLTPPRLYERDVAKQCKDLLRAGGWDVIRLQSGVFVGASGGAPLRIGERGMTDYVAVRARGRVQVLYVEIKRPGQFPRIEQERWMAWKRHCGFEAFWVDSVEDLEKHLRRINAD
jgi:hypothetical protein